MNRFTPKLICVLLLFACSKNDFQLADHEFVFIEFHKVRVGRLIEGELQNAVGIPFCCPTYHFNEAKGELTGEINFRVNKSLKVVYGNVEEAIGAIGRSTASYLRGLYEIPSDSIPYDFLQFKVHSIEEGGIARISNNFYQPFSLGANDSRTFTHSVDTVTYQMNWGDVVIEITETHKFINYGILSKGDIVPFF